MNINIFIIIANIKKLSTISTGGTISETVNNIINIFIPNKITVITLFSKI